jgi:hypothetical protein
MEIGIRIEKIKNIFGRDNLKKQMRFCLWILGIIAIGYTAYIWYECIYRPEWSEAEKQEYMKSKDRGIVFNRNRFDEIVSAHKAREERFDAKPEELKDIFRIKE